MSRFAWLHCLNPRYDVLTRVRSQGQTKSLGMGDTPKPSGKPNILFIAANEMRPQLGCYGHEKPLSPHIDKLVSRGTIFKCAFCNVPVCGPSRVSVLTGIRPRPNQWRCSDLMVDDTTLPAYFKEHGYHALSNGKVLHLLERPHGGLERTALALHRNLPRENGPGQLQCLRHLAG